MLGHDAGFEVPNEFSFDVVSRIAQKTPEVILALTVGGIVIGLPLAVLGYYLSYSVIRRYRERSRRRSERRASRQSARVKWGK